MREELVDKLAVLLEAFEESAWRVVVNATHAGAENEDIMLTLQNMVKEVGVRVSKFNANLAQLTPSPSNKTKPGLSIGDEVLVHDKWIGCIRKIHCRRLNAPHRYFVQWRHPSEPDLQSGWFDQGELEKHGTE